MKAAKIFSCLLCCITLSCFHGFAQHRVIKWAVQKHGTLWVNGTSNVNDFSCSITSISEYDTIIALYDPIKAVTLRGSIKMNIFSFDCHNNMIRKDLRKTLKAEKYPNLIIRFLTLRTMPLISAKSEQVTGWVEVELAGVKKKFELNYSFRETSPGLMRLNGGRKFNFSDFKLAPPEKFAGFVKIRDEFDVNFTLILKTM